MMELFKRFHASLSFEFFPLQKREIALGRENGLSKEQIELYASPCFNFLQMKEIRIALEHGMEKKKVRILADPQLEVEDMRKLRWRMERGEIVHGRGACMVLKMFSIL